MVKNTTGGSSHKKFARKSHGGGRDELSWDKSDPYLLEVSVTKALGDCRFSISTKDRRTLICHVSSRFSGRHKHHNMVVVNSVLLVSLRPYENPAKHCDYIQKISDTTPVDFFTVRLPNEPNQTTESDLDIFRNNATMNHPVEKAGDNPIETIHEDTDIDFDAI